MALKKKTAKNGSHSEVTFKVSAKHAPSNSDTFLLGDFNNWQVGDTAFQMDKKRGAFSKTLTLENGKRYEFRYVNREFTWFNDDAADDYVPSPFYGVDNCVVDLTKITVKKAAPKSVKKVKVDDLTKIEGIGPKIAGLLRTADIATFESLSAAKITTLKSILKAAGPRYAVHQPKTWPKQAKLAAKGDWEALKKLQDKLDGGK